MSVNVNVDDVLPNVDEMGKISRSVVEKHDDKFRGIDVSDVLRKIGDGIRSESAAGNFRYYADITTKTPDEVEAVIVKLRDARYGAVCYDISDDSDGTHAQINISWGFGI